MIDRSKREDSGVAEALVERFEKWVLPYALDIKAKLDEGEKLDDHDIHFLESELKQVHQIKSLVDRMPEYQNLYMRAISLYEEIAERAVEAEQTGDKPGVTL